MQGPRTPSAPSEARAPAGRCCPTRPRLRLPCCEALGGLARGSHVALGARAWLLARPARFRNTYFRVPFMTEKISEPTDSDRPPSLEKEHTGGKECGGGEALSST